MIFYTQFGSLLHCDNVRLCGGVDTWYGNMGHQHCILLMMDNFLASTVNIMPGGIFKLLTWYVPGSLCTSSKIVVETFTF